MRANIFLDESGDFGWTFDKPFKKGGSSKYLTLAAIVAPNEKSHLITNIVRGLYKSRKRHTSNELKSVELSGGERQLFIKALCQLKAKHADFLFVGITVNKLNVNQSFRSNPNGLYNFMTKLLLLNLMRNYSSIDFIPDARSIKNLYEHSLHQYLEQMLLEKTMEGASEVRLVTTPMESKHHLEIQAADILASLFWAKYEFSNDAVDQLSNICEHKKLFF